MESEITISISYNALTLILSLFYFIPIILCILVFLIISINKKIERMETLSRLEKMKEKKMENMEDRIVDKMKNVDIIEEIGKMNEIDL